MPKIAAVIEAPEQPATAKEKGSAFWEATLADLAAKQKAAADRHLDVKARARTFALQAVVLGGAEARKQLDRLNREARDLADSIDEMTAAEMSAREELSAAKAAENASAAHLWRRRSGDIARRTVAAAEAVDAAFQQLGRTCDLFKDELRRLAVEPGNETLQRSTLFDRGVFQRAGRYHLLGRHLDLPSPIAGLHERPLAEVVGSHLESWLKEEK